MKADQLRRYAADPAAFRADLHIRTGTGVHRFGDIVQPFQLERFAIADPALLAVARGDKPPVEGIWDERTKGASKDSDWAINLLWLLAFSPRPLRVEIGAYDARQAGEVKRIVKQILRINAPLNNLLAQQVVVQADRIVNLRTESEAEILSKDSRGSHGSRPDVVMIDEITHIDDGEGQEFCQTLLDNSDKMPNGLTVICTNAGHLDTWQATWKAIAEDSPDWTVLEYSEPSPWTSKGKLRRAEQRNTPARYFRLWHGVWSSGDAEGIGDHLIDSAVRHYGPMHYPEPGYTYLAGLDLAHSQDHAAFVVLASRFIDGVVRVAYAKSWAPSATTGKISLMDVEQHVIDRCLHFHVSALYFDVWQAFRSAEAFEQHGINAIPRNFSGTQTFEMAVGLLNVFQSGTIELYDDPTLVTHLKQLRLVEKPKGFRLEAVRTRGGHGDLGIALALPLPEAIRRALSPSQMEDCHARGIPYPRSDKSTRGIQLSQPTRTERFQQRGIQFSPSGNSPVLTTHHLI